MARSSGVVGLHVGIYYIIRESIGYRDPVKMSCTPPSLIIPTMKPSLWQLAQRRLSTRNWTSQSCLFAPRKQTLNTAPDGGSSSIGRRKHASDAREKSQNLYFVTTPTFYANTGTHSPSLSRFCEVHWLRQYARSTFSAFMNPSPG